MVNAEAVGRSRRSPSPSSLPGRALAPGHLLRLTSAPAAPRPTPPKAPAHSLYRAMDRSCICLGLCFAALLGVAASSNEPNASAENFSTVGSLTSTAAMTKPPPTSSPSPMILMPTATDAPQDCFIRKEWTLWVLVAAGAAVAVPLICAMGLMIQVCHLKRQVRPGRTPRTNVDLVSGMRSPGATGGGADGGASAGLCESAIKMEEVKLQEQAKEEEAREEAAREEAAKDGTEQGAVDKAGDSGNGEAARESSAPAAASSQSEEVPAAAAEGEMEVLVVV
ncbi:hypothetical protein MATL_G00115050 [Megalops atlanticus]|uniref:Uncharacterized protein n=1 Tax=Megalops atlanticus TaxID=7932 RepID=A0A9D3T4G4_MEGAT|nr:hypothetical protein MATL_G00115050 [Megalops atlanticus]